MKIGTNKKGTLKVAKTATIVSGILQVTFDNYTPSKGETINVISAQKVQGKFIKIVIDGYTVTPQYTGSSIKLYIDEN